VIDLGRRVLQSLGSTVTRTRISNGLQNQTSFIRIRTAQREKLQTLNRRTPRWIVVMGALALLGYAATQMTRMGVFDAILKMIAAAHNFI
jgi:hypothetical protein